MSQDDKPTFKNQFEALMILLLDFRERLKSEPLLRQNHLITDEAIGVFGQCSWPIEDTDQQKN